MIHHLLPFVVAGLATGSVYAIAAMGLVLTYKTSGLFNFAHGAQAAVGAYVMWELWVGHHWPWLPALVAALVVAGVIGGLLLERVAFLLADKPASARIVATVGLLITLQGLLAVRYGSATIPVRYFLPTSTVSLGGVNVRYEQLIVFVAAAATAAGLTVLFRRTRLGLAMQGVVDNAALVGLHGVSPIAVRRSAWIIGSCFAALSGALLAPTLGLDATLLTLLVVQAFGAAAVGGFSSLPLTYLGGIIVGLGQELLKYAIGQDVVARHVSSQILQPLPTNFPFLVLFGVLVFSPRRRLVERGAEAVRRASRPASWSTRTRIVATAGGAAILLLIPALTTTRQPVYTAGLAYAVIFTSLFLLVRLSGQVSLCQMTFAAIGAASYVHAARAGVPFPMALLWAGVVAVPVGAFIAIPAIRLSGVYLAIATFGFGILVERIFFSSFVLFGIRTALLAPRPAFARSDTAYYYLVLLVAVMCFGVVVAVRASRLGRMLQALGDSPRGVVAHGASTNVVQTIAFCLSAFLAAIGGALLGPVTGSASGGTFSFGTSLTLLAVLLIFGRRPVLASVAASAAFVVGPAYVTNIDWLPWTPVVFGMSAMILTSGLPRHVRGWMRKSQRLVEREGRTTRVTARSSEVSAA